MHQLSKTCGALLILCSYSFLDSFLESNNEAILAKVYGLECYIIHVLARKFCLSTLGWLIEPNRQHYQCCGSEIKYYPRQITIKKPTIYTTLTTHCIQIIVKGEKNRNLITFSVGSSYNLLLSIKDNNDKSTLNSCDK